MPSWLKRSGSLALIIVVGYIFGVGQNTDQRSGRTGTQLSSGEVLSAQTKPSANTKLYRAFAEHRSDVQTYGSGTVQVVLPDDIKGSRHQRFILDIGRGQTILVAHNIDLAPRIAGLEPGDRVEFYGEYEWNDKGGVVHWTHHDPRESHVDGYLKHQNRVYQ